MPNKFKILKLLKLLFNYSGEKSACEVKKKLILQKLKILSEWKKSKVGNLKLR